MARLIDWRTKRPDVDAVATAIRAGQVAILPTDTCYGIACDAFNSDAVSRLKLARSMPSDVPVTVMAKDLDVVSALAVDIPDRTRRLAQTYWPGPLSILLTAQPSLNWNLGASGNTVAVRVPNYPLLLELLDACGPLAVSQASPMGVPPPFTVDEALLSMGDGVDIAVEGGALEARPRSTFVDGRDDDLALLRAGPISIGDLLAAAEAKSNGEQAAVELPGSGTIADDVDRV